MHLSLLTTRRLGASVVALGLALAGCETEPTVSITSDDPGFKALASGDYATSRTEFEPMLAKTSNDPYVELDLGVAYQGLGRMDLADPLYRQAMINGKDIRPPVATFDRDKGKSIAEVACENIEIGYKTDNCAAPVPPKPQPLPQPVKTFIVFFDFNRARLTNDGEAIVAEAVKAARTQGTAHIVVTGHTDTVGSDRYNERLALQRANAVRAAMIRDGLNGSAVTTEGRGFHDLLVSTAPGVREPRNRRAVIDLGG